MLLPRGGHSWSQDSAAKTISSHWVDTDRREAATKILRQEHVIGIITVGSQVSIQGRKLRYRLVGRPGGTRGKPTMGRMCTITY